VTFAVAGTNASFRRFLTTALLGAESCVENRPTVGTVAGQAGILKGATVNAGYNDSSCNDIRPITIRYACHPDLLYKITIFSV
jgi:hypothetical protein